MLLGRATPATLAVARRGGALVRLNSSRLLALAGDASVSRSLPRAGGLGVVGVLGEVQVRRRLLRVREPEKEVPVWDRR
jgi:hypothetical protein